MKDSKKSIVPGAILILIGVLIIIHKMDIFNFYWRNLYPVIFLALGAWFFFNVFLRKQRGQAFPGTLFLLLGIFFILRNYSLFYPYYIDEFWPVFLIIFGLAFVVQFLFRPDDWGLLIPGFIFLLLGFVFLARTMGWFLPYQIEYIVETYWPVLLILIGIAIIFSGLKKKQPESIESEKGE
ncbi:MAG TPA: hypothetical protein ENH29_03115 [Bacteroidetes bacterium]|nr:hypothetical protein [Bacteroidota bacterium]